jgi:hypothetical protein
LSTSDPPDAVSRAEAQVTLKELGPRIRRMATVPLGESLRGSVVRAIMRAMVMISGFGKVHQIASTTRDALDWLYGSAGSGTPPRREAEAVIAELYSSLAVSDPELRRAR